jgi:hypothetical protein
MVRILLQPILQAAVLPVEWVAPDQILKQVECIPRAVVPAGVDATFRAPRPPLSAVPRGA